MWNNFINSVQVRITLRSHLSISHLNNSAAPDDIGIITPYHGQVLKIRQVLANSAMSKVKVASVEEYQGQVREMNITV